MLGGREMRSGWRVAMGSVAVLTLLVFGLLVPASPALASYVGGTPPQVGAVDSLPAAGVHPGIGGANGATPRASTGALPMTGGDIVGLSLLALGVSGAGLLLSRLGRRPSTTSA